MVAPAMKEPEAETHRLDQHRDPTEAAVVWSLAAVSVSRDRGRRAPRSATTSIDHGDAAETPFELGAEIEPSGGAHAACEEETD